MSGVDAAALLLAIVLEYAFRVWYVFRKLQTQLEVWRVVSVLVEVGSVRARLL